jgi:hypothetical protein
MVERKFVLEKKDCGRIEIKNSHSKHNFTTPNSDGIKYEEVMKNLKDGDRIVITIEKEESQFDKLWDAIQKVKQHGYEPEFFDKIERTLEIFNSYARIRALAKAEAKSQFDKLWDAIQKINERIDNLN